jgi:hypothetical protein
VLGVAPHVVNTDEIDELIATVASVAPPKNITFPMNSPARDG